MSHLRCEPSWKWPDRRCAQWAVTAAPSAAAAAATASSRNSVAMRENTKLNEEIEGFGLSGGMPHDRFGQQSWLVLLRAKPTHGHSWRGLTVVTCRRDNDAGTPRRTLLWTRPSPGNTDHHWSQTFTHPRLLQQSCLAHNPYTTWSWFACLYSAGNYCRNIIWGRDSEPWW